MTPQHKQIHGLHSVKKGTLSLQVTVYKYLIAVYGLYSVKERYIIIASHSI